MCTTILGLFDKVGYERMKVIRKAIGIHIMTLVFYLIYPEYEQ